MQIKNKDQLEIGKVIYILSIHPGGKNQILNPSVHITKGKIVTKYKHYSVVLLFDNIHTFTIWHDFYKNPNIFVFDECNSAIEKIKDILDQ